MEQLEDGPVSVFSLDHIVVLLLEAVHRRCVLIKVTSEYDEILVGCKSLRIFIERLAHEIVHFFHLLVTRYECLDVERNALTIVTGLEMRVEQVKFVATDFTKINLRVQNAFHGDTVVTYGRELIRIVFRRNDWVARNSEQACITAICAEVFGAGRKSVVG